MDNKSPKNYTRWSRLIIQSSKSRKRFNRLPVVVVEVLPNERVWLVHVVEYLNQSTSDGWTVVTTCLLFQLFLQHVLKIKMGFGYAMMQILADISYVSIQYITIILIPHMVFYFTSIMYFDTTLSTNTYLWITVFMWVVRNEILSNLIIKQECPRTMAQPK